MSANNTSGLLPSHLTDNKLHVIVGPASELDGLSGGGAETVAPALGALLLGRGIQHLHTGVLTYCI